MKTRNFGGGGRGEGPRGLRIGTKRQRPARRPAFYVFRQKLLTETQDYASALAASSTATGAASAPASLPTVTFTVTVTSLCSLTGTLNSPTVFNGTSRSILRRSMVKPLASSACAMSDEVTEPNN